MLSLRSRYLFSVVRVGKKSYTEGEAEAVGSGPAATERGPIMAVNNLLVAFDESEGGRRALDMAVSLAEVNPAVHIDVAYVVPIPLLDESQMASFKEILDMMISDGEDLLAEAVADVREDVAARIDSLLLTGTNPATEILKLVDQREYDLVVVGNRGLSGLKEYLGSVSHKILHGSKIPVLVAK